MNWSLNLGRIAGIPIKIHWTLLVFLGLSLFMGSGVYGLILMVLLFASVLAHEMGHSLVARRLGFPIANIELYPFGGMARLISMPKEPMLEVYIAMAGPLVSLALGVLGLVAGVIFQVDMILQLGTINMVLGVFNLLPALPMDGGRIFRALLSRRLGHLRATTIAATVAKFLAAGLSVVGFLYSPWLIAIALIVYLMARAEEHGARLAAAEEAAEQEQAFMPRTWYNGSEPYEDVVVIKDGSKVIVISQPRR